jgi:hypothetical protein
MYGTWAVWAFTINYRLIGIILGKEIHSGHDSINQPGPPCLYLTIGLLINLSIPIAFSNIYIFK